MASETERRAIQDQLGVPNLCYGCGPDNPDGLQLKSYWEDDRAVATYVPRPAFMAGPPNVLNGGIIATLLDCHSVCTAIAAAYRAEGRPMGTAPQLWCVTGSLRIDYLKPTPIAAPVLLRARVVAVSGRRLTVACTLHSGDTECARAETVAVRVPLGWSG